MGGAVPIGGDRRDAGPVRVHGRRHPVQAFTEHGAIMAATVLNSARAIAVSLFVVRAFIEMRESMAQNREIGKRLDELEARVEERLGKQDQVIVEILDAIHQLMSPPAAPAKRGIGFVR